MQPYFLPYMGYFQLIKHVDIFVNLDHVSFMKRSYMTRNVLHNEQEINIQMSHASQNKACDETQVFIDDHYVKKFLRKIEFNYSKTPHYELISQKIAKWITSGNGKSISEFNLQIIKEICSYLEIKTEVVDTSRGMSELSREDCLIEITKKLQCEEYVNPIGGIELYKKSYFNDRNIKLSFIKMNEIENWNLSILHHLFNKDVQTINKQLDLYEIL